jgi:hypothetical protein
MALRRSSIAALVLIALAGPAAAEDYNTNYASRSDFISLSTGDAPQSNIAIQHPTPWPSYVNDTRFLTPARRGVSALEKMFKRYEGGSASGPSTVINIGK